MSTHICFYKIILLENWDNIINNKNQRLMDQQLLIKDYSSMRRYCTNSALGDYSNPTISSNNKARSRSSSRKSKLIKRPYSRYGTINPITQCREQIQLTYPRNSYHHIIIMADEIKRGVSITLDNEMEKILMKVCFDHIDIQQNSVNQTLNIQPIAPNIKKVKICFGQFSKNLISLKIKSLQGKINPNSVFTDSTVLFQSDLFVLQPFLMMGQAEALRKKMLLRMNSKKTSVFHPLRQIQATNNQLKHEQPALIRKQSLRPRYGLGGIPSSRNLLQRLSKNNNENQFVQVAQDLGKIGTNMLERNSSKKTFKKLKQESKIPRGQKRGSEVSSMISSQVKQLRKQQ